MDIQFTTADILTMLQSLSISSMATVPKQRQSNTLLAARMQNQNNPGHTDQFNTLYLDRLAKLAKRMPFPKICKIQDVDGNLDTLHIVGIFKRLQVKRVRAFQKHFDQYYSNIKRIYDERDTLELEDASGKLKFVLQPGATMNGKQVKPTELPYGIIIGLTGIYDEQKMQFKANKITLPNLAPQKPFIYQRYESPRKTLMMSCPNIESLQNSFLQICGLGNLNIYNTIKSIIVIGFSDKLTPKDFKQLDSILEKYGDTIDIFVMQNEKQGEMYPNKPIHPIMLNKSYKKVSLVNNPQIFYPNVDDKEPEDVDMSQLSGSILVCSGQNIKDLIINCQYGENSLDTMQSILEYSHIAPTCPFSLKCEMTPEDYLIMHKLPHVFVAGNCEKTMMRDFRDSDGNRKVRLVALKSGDMILVDIDNHEVEKFKFGAAAADIL